MKVQGHRIVLPLMSGSSSQSDSEEIITKRRSRLNNNNNNNNKTNNLNNFRPSRIFYSTSLDDLNKADVSSKFEKKGAENLISSSLAEMPSENSRVHAVESGVRRNFKSTEASANLIYRISRSIKISKIGKQKKSEKNEILSS